MSIYHGIKIIGLKAAAGESKKCDYYGLHLDLGYDLSDGRLYTSEYHSCNSWSEWRYPIIATQIGRASVGKECRSRWSPYH